MKKAFLPLALLSAVVLIGAGCTQEQNTNTSDNTNYTVEVTPINKDDFMEEMEQMDSEDDTMMEEDHSDDAMENEVMEKDSEAMEKDADGEAMDSEESSEETTGAVMEKETTSTETEAEEESAEEETEEEVEEEQAAAPGVYTDYDSSQVASAASNGDAVLFFHASWCPSCKALDSSINSGDVPDGLTIFKVNYDKEDELRKKYGVTYQHTLVQVDSSGELITKWSGGNTLNSIVSKVQ